MMEKIMEVVKIKQIIKEGFMDCPIIRSPEDAYQVAREYIGQSDREEFLVIALNTKNRVIAVHIAHIGSLNSSLVNPREVFKVLILNNACSFIVVHNHPTQDTQPSLEDRQVTNRLVECSKYMGIELLDHIIVCESTFYSFKEHGDI